MFPAEIFGLSALTLLLHVFLQAIGSAPCISLLEDYLCIIETPIRVRDKRDQESRLKLMTGNSPTICTGEISLLLSFLGLGFFVELIFDLLISSGINLGHVIIKRPCGMGKCCIGVPGQNHVNIGIIVAE
jgi:hypothetical protein